MLFLGIDNLSDIDLTTFTSEEKMDQSLEVEEGESYSNLQNVVDYLYLYEELPPNYLTKQEAQELGWEASKGNLWEVAPEMSIGGDYFGNFEGLLPEATDRQYTEADINYEGGYRGGERLVFSTDGLYYYTDDHYESFNEVTPSSDVP